MTAFVRWISILGHPFVTVTIMVTTAALHFGTTADAAQTIPIVLMITLAPMAILMVRQVRRGAWQNVDASNPRERPIVFVIGFFSLLLLLGYLRLVEPPSFAIRGALGTLVMLAVCAVGTLWIKVSLHMAFAMLATTTLLLFRSAIGWILLVEIPILAWSRLVLSRHTLTEVIAGGLIGLITGIAIYSL